MSYTNEQIIGFAADMGVSIEEAKRIWEANEAETARYAAEHGISLEEADAILTRKEMDEIGVTPAFAELMHKNKEAFTDEEIEAVTKLRRQ